MTLYFSKTTAVRNAVALSYHRMCGLCFPAVVFAATIIYIIIKQRCLSKVPKPLCVFASLCKLTLVTNSIVEKLICSKKGAFRFWFKEMQRQ